jgi:hypothetical protein
VAGEEAVTVDIAKMRDLLAQAKTLRSVGDWSGCDRDMLLLLDLLVAAHDPAPAAAVVTAAERLVVYVAGPVSPSAEGTTAQHYERAKAVAQTVIDAGHAPILPHFFVHLHDCRPRDYEEWMAIDGALLLKCDVLLRMQGASKGADREVTAAIKAGIRVVYSVAELPPLEKP